jgi:hypothetical protein
MRAEHSSRGTVVDSVDERFISICAEQRALLRSIAEADKQQVWIRDGARDMGQWLAGRFGITTTFGRHLARSAHALEKLPQISAAFESGELSQDKMIQLTRFATADTEAQLVRWSRRVSVNAVRAKADLANAPAVEQVKAADRERLLRWWYFDEGTRLGFEGSMPADQGAIFVSAIERRAARMAQLPTDFERVYGGQSDPGAATIDARRADALVEMASQQIASDDDADRATVVVHAELSALMGSGEGAEIEGGPVIPGVIAQEMACDGRLEFVIRDGERGTIGIGRAARNVPAWLMRELRNRDRCCTFPGCGSTRMLKAHHILWWDRDQGPTDLDNLTLVCAFHHKLLHRHGWSVKLTPSGRTIWYRPNKTMFAPGPRVSKTASRDGSVTPRGSPALV